MKRGMCLQRLKERLMEQYPFADLNDGSEMYKWNRAQQSTAHAVERSYLRRACNVTRWYGESNESGYERCGMGTCAMEVNCELVEWVNKRIMSRWFGQRKYIVWSLCSKCT